MVHSLELTLKLYHFAPLVWDVVYKGNEAPPFQKLMGVQAMTVGNHEWCAV